MEFDPNGKHEVYNIDLDGTLTNGEPFWGGVPVTVNETVKEAVRTAYKNGNIIIVWTARQWEFAPETVGWLIANRIPFHGIYMGKGGADYYIDDKSVLPDKFTDKFFKE